MAFASPVHYRLALACAVASTGWVGLWMVESHNLPSPVVAEPVVAVPTREVRLTLTASTPIAAWAVSQLGVPVAGTSDATSWHGTAIVPATTCDLLIEAAPTTDDGPVWALRLQANGPDLRHDRTAWAPKTQVELLVLPATQP